MSTCLSPYRLCADLLEQNQPTFVVPLLTLDNLPDRMALSRRRIFQVADLSTDVGELNAHHGVDG